MAIDELAMFKALPSNLPRLDSILSLPRKWSNWFVSTIKHHYPSDIFDTQEWLTMTLTLGMMVFYLFFCYVSS
ncbi:Serine/threonine-protein kinase BUR1 [Fusarium oxysporum f. sp. albedinis]|nr:Serine/threonine-protein kinase BUR1 [Fusarium oxysporum f. sp. albedinis]